MVTKRHTRIYIYKQSQLYIKAKEGCVPEKQRHTQTDKMTHRQTLLHVLRRHSPG